MKLTDEVLQKAAAEVDAAILAQLGREMDEELAGKLLYKNARKIAYTNALELARKAETDEERNFFAYIADMNLQREQQAYIQNEKYGPSIPLELTPLTPSPDGKECLGNGTWPGYECQCDECDYYLACFPEYA